MSTVVSIRLDDEVVEAIRRKGRSPGSYLAEVLEVQLRLERSMDSVEWFRKNRFRTHGKTGVELIRKDRDSR
ncbi:MAG: hypothetical protein MUC62_10135 [Candidatus Thermoplasmatota archaeon]|jgi:hypothetical protein|nr:hypothetical protein [Candidatus Thermoplasmatota archaeon]